MHEPTRRPAAGAVHAWARAAARAGCCCRAARARGPAGRETCAGARAGNSSPGVGRIGEGLQLAAGQPRRRASEQQCPPVHAAQLGMRRSAALLESEHAADAWAPVPFMSSAGCRSGAPAGSGSPGRRPRWSGPRPTARARRPRSARRWRAALPPARRAASPAARGCRSRRAGSSGTGAPGPCRVPRAASVRVRPNPNGRRCRMPFAHPQCPGRRGVRSRRRNQGPAGGAAAGAARGPLRMQTPARPAACKHNIRASGAARASRRRPAGAARLHSCCPPSSSAICARISGFRLLTTTRVKLAPCAGPLPAAAAAAAAAAPARSASIHARTSGANAASAGASVDGSPGSRCSRSSTYTSCGRAPLMCRQDKGRVRDRAGADRRATGTSAPGMQRHAATALGPAQGAGQRPARRLRRQLQLRRAPGPRGAPASRGIAPPAPRPRCPARARTRSRPAWWPRGCSGPGRTPHFWSRPAGGGAATRVTSPAPGSPGTGLAERQAPARGGCGARGAYPKERQVAGEEALGRLADARGAGGPRRQAAVGHAEVHNGPVVELARAHAAAVVPDGDEPRARRAGAARAGERDLDPPRALVALGRAQRVVHQLRERVRERRAALRATLAAPRSARAARLGSLQVLHTDALAAPRSARAARLGSLQMVQADRGRRVAAGARDSRQGAPAPQSTRSRPPAAARALGQCAARPVRQGGARTQRAARVARQPGA